MVTLSLERNPISLFNIKQSDDEIKQITDEIRNSSLFTKRFDIDVATLLATSSLYAKLSARGLHGNRMQTEISETMLHHY